MKAFNIIFGYLFLLMAATAMIFTFMGFYWQFAIWIMCSFVSALLLTEKIEKT